MTVWLLLEAIDLGDHVRGVFAEREQANAAAWELCRRDKLRLGVAMGVTMAGLRVEEMTMGELDYPVSKL